MRLERCKSVLTLVKLEKRCQTHISLQNFVLIQPRTSPPKNRALALRRATGETDPAQHLLLDAARPVVLILPDRHRGGALPAKTAARCSGRQHRPATQRPIGKISAKCCSFSAVSAPIFARKYAFCSIFQNLPDYLAAIFEIWQNFANFATCANFLLNFHRNC